MRFFARQAVEACWHYREPANRARSLSELIAIYGDEPEWTELIESAFEVLAEMLRQRRDPE
jgi:uncharacterized protein (DUF427 family)